MSGGRKEQVCTEVEFEGARWLVVEAWRARSGLRLLYFLPLEAGTPVADDRRDRRAALASEAELASLDARRWEELWAEAVGLTETERRFVDAEGAPWLVQNVGPVWAEAEVAVGLTGLVFTQLTGARLTGARQRRTGPGGHVAGMSEGEIRSRLEAAYDE